MKLIFPNGEHPQALLNDGVTRIGSAPDAQIRLNLPNIAPVHCELQLSVGIVTVRVPDRTHPVSLNGKPVQGVMAVRGGDLIGIGSVQARLVIMEKAKAVAAANADPDADTGATRLRMAVPRFVLRGVSGPAFGKTYPIPSEQTIGRAQECDICVPSDEISRKHALVKPSPEGLSVEDLGSANGTFINGKRVQKGVLKPGDELRLDAIRFLLVAPGMDMTGASRPTAAVAQKQSAAAPTKTNMGLLIGAAVVLAVAIAAVVYLL
jgi:pSer/pThr/pTyr-binding forkhead associated (FHA) protein